MRDEPGHIAGAHAQLGAVLKKRRHDLGLSQEELANRAGLHRTYITDVERGSRNPSLDTIQKLARALEVPLSGLFLEVESAAGGAPRPAE
jgi:transcriptional regulator with XRE-family HTH domain